MVKQRIGSTKSANKFRYTSFRNKIDDLKIEPAKSLIKRHHDYVETSHFLSTFEHWKDINRSGNFSSFAEENESKIQTLAQILHHQQAIFNSLKVHIDLHDDKSLEPLCELLAQFVHDLGPDFMVYYEDSLKCLLDMLENAVSIENSSVFEWGFNCLAYIFKYLSRVLAQDLSRTFELLFPLLSHQKEYLSRFSAEALSFLVRKSKATSLTNFIESSVAKLDETHDVHFYDGLETLFEESMKTTSESLHSKTNIIIGTLLAQVINSNGVESISLFCDILMDILRHASHDNVAEVYQFILEKLSESVVSEKCANTDKIAKILATLAFAESGKKVPTWEAFVTVVQKLMTNVSAENKPRAETFSFLFAVLLRNADVSILTQFHKKMFEFYLAEYPETFLEFFTTCLKMASERVFTFNGSKFLQNYIKEHWTFNSEKIALFLFNLEENEYVKEKLNIILPEAFISSTVSDMLSANENYYKVLTCSSILSYCKSYGQNIDYFPYLQEMSKNLNEFDDFQKDVFGILLGLNLCKHSIEDESVFELLSFVKKDAFSLRSSLFFVKGLRTLLQHLQKNELFAAKLTQLVKEDDYFLIKELTNNLLLPNSKLRYETLYLLYDLMRMVNYEVPNVLKTCAILEEIPQTLEHARDFTARIRAMGSEFTKTTSNPIHNMIFFKHMFGLLNVRFSPIWDGVYEILPNVYEKDQQLVWDLSLHFLTVLDKNSLVQYPEDPMPESTRDDWWSVSVVRLDDAISGCNKVFDEYFFEKGSFFDIMKERRGNLEYPQLIRNQTLKLLLSISSLAERHSRDLVPFFFNNKENEEIFGEQPENKCNTAATWNDADRNLLLKLLAKFSNIRSVYHSDEIYERLMTLLSSRNSEVQKLALSAIFAYKDKTINKYKDNLNSLLDDTLFKDEISRLMATDESKIVENQDEHVLIPVILRILFGRAQTPSTSGIKKSRKNAVISVLPNFEEKYVTQFLQLGSERLNYAYYFDHYIVAKEEVTLLTLRRIAGFVTIINSLFSVLGTKFPNSLESTIAPLIYSSAVSSFVLREKMSENNIDKMAINARQQIMKAFYQLFEYYSETLPWDLYIDDFFKVVVSPRLEAFEDENLQQPSAIMKMITFWSSNKRLYKFLYYKDYAAARALMRTLSNDKAKESVVAIILSFVNNLVTGATEETSYAELVAICVSGSLLKLPVLFSEAMSPEVSTTAVNVLLNITNAGFIQDNDTRRLLVNSLSVALENHAKNISIKDIAKILSVLVTVVADYDCSWNDIEPLYEQLSALFRHYVDRTVRATLAKVFVSIAQRFPDFERVANLLSDLNSYSNDRMQGYDFERRLPAFKQIVENDFRTMSDLEWMPILYSCLFFINDFDELAIRTNATSVINSFSDYLNLQTDDATLHKALKLMKQIVLPNLKLGLRKKKDDIKNEYISVLAYIVTNSKVFTDLNDMKVLLMKGDQEADFFFNVNHIQIHRRQRAVKRLCELAPQLHENSISHYLIPAIESWVFCDDEKYRNLCNEVIIALGTLSNFLSWNQYKALIRRYKSMLKMDSPHLKEIVLVIVNLSVSVKNSLLSLRDDSDGLPSIRKFPSKLDEPKSFIENELYPDLTKFLNKRDDETIVARIPLSEATVNLILGLPQDTVVSYLPGTLTSVCQVLRSRSEELRDAVRKNLSKLAVILGAAYLAFIIKELRGALTRGSQIHVLSFSIHHVLVSLNGYLVQGDMDGSADMIAGVIMEDTFGAAGQEKDAEGYTSKMKEVKHNKSYDTAEILSNNISLEKFGSLLHPVKALLLEKLPLKVQHKLDELLRRYVLGLAKSVESAKFEVLALCHEIYQQSLGSETNKIFKRKPTLDEKEEFFIVDLNSKSGNVETENSLYVHTLQKLSFDLLRTSLSKNANLMNAQYLEGFIPILKKSLNSADEGVLISTLRILTMIVKIDFSEDNEPIFKNCARKVFNIIKDSPSTSSELCQLGLKFLSVLIRHKDVEIKNSSLSYILTRILPDFNEPHKQGLAFNFLKSLIAKHVVLPELYDVVDVVSEIMIANHTKEIRDVARSVFFQFMMEYDHSKGRLEKKFKFLIDNLQYSSPEGRMSVMETISLVINKSTVELLSKLSSSLFVSLANVAVNDSFPKCREMASHLLHNLLTKVGEDGTTTMEKYIIAWLKQTSNNQYLSLGLRIYKIYLEVFGLNKEHNQELHELAILRIQYIIENTTLGSEIPWELIYLALQLFGSYSNKSGAETFKQSFQTTWKNVSNCLLYPHSWVRLAATRLIYLMVEQRENFEFPPSDYDVQTIAFRVFRQLGAPSISEKLADASVKILVQIIISWKEKDQQYITPKGQEHEEEIDDEEELKYTSSVDFAVSKAAHILRSEKLVLSESFVGKKAMIQLLALMVQILDSATIEKESEKIIMSLFMFLEKENSIDEQEEELQDLAKECLQFLESKLTVSQFTTAYAAVKQKVYVRRQERKAKRAVLAVKAPDVAANRKFKKHARSREKRKHQKDENGFYKKKRRV
ncbi:hypothetical protein ACO0QE_001456 [Hanseniaspora vineae]